MGVTEILKKSTTNTKEILGLELEYKKQDLENQWHYSSLERIFIENRIYREIEDVETWEGVLNTIDNGLKPYSSKLKRKIIEEDLVRLTEIKIKRISKPGIRVYSKINDLEKPYGGLGISILSTPKGVMSDQQARKNNVGGEVLCEVF